MWPLSKAVSQRPGRSSDRALIVFILFLQWVFILLYIMLLMCFPAFLFFFSLITKIFANIKLSLCWHCPSFELPLSLIFQWLCVQVYCSCFKYWSFSNKVLLKIKSLKNKKNKIKKIKFMGWLVLYGTLVCPSITVCCTLFNSFCYFVIIDYVTWEYVSLFDGIACNTIVK